MKMKTKTRLQKMAKKKSKRRILLTSIPENADGNTIFALALASIVRSSIDEDTHSQKKPKLQDNSHSPLLIKKCLDRLLLCLLSESPNHLILTAHLTLPSHIISLFPLLLTSRYTEIKSKSAEIVGAAALFSLEMNEQVASDLDILRALMSALASPEKTIAIAACNAILDLCTTSHGRQQFLKSSALEHLIYYFFQEPKSSTALVSLLGKESRQEATPTPRIVCKNDDFQLLVSDVATTLVNACSIEQLETMPVKFSESLQIYFKKIWLEVHSPVFSGRLSSLRRSSLAESIFRMSMNASDQLQKPLTRNIIRRSIFGTDVTTFENFMLNHWEMQPLYLARSSKLLQEQDDIFSSIKKTLAFDEDFQDLSLFLQKLVSCPPITSDELDILGFLEEARCHLGFPISYQQDIRVLKTEHMKGEVHFFREVSHILYKHDILRCDRAFEDGYTIALRGMEFRFKKIAEIVDGLASLFGQPSAGINMYITPPNSQGLARHYDDHCVLVVQLYGVKKWTVYCKSGPDLPRLYGSLNSLNVMEAGNLSGDDTCLQYLLKEGDVLYIPRGFPHEAHTVVDNDMTQSSLHLTLSLEVELPFEWEGFVHVAFFSWYHKQNKSDQSSSDPLSTILTDLALKLVHVSISLLADSYPTFQKACLVGAVPEPSDCCDWLSTNQRERFSELIKQVKAESNFLYIVKHMSSSLEKNEDPLQQLRWLRNLEDDSAEKHVSLVNEHIILCNRYKDEVGAAFCQVKSRFCSEVVFDDVRLYYTQLLKKYRKTRKQYMNGMLLGFADADCLM